MPKLLPLLAAAAAALVLLSAAYGADHRLAAGGKTAYTIVVDPGATAAESHAADELARFLEEVTGVVFPVKHTVVMPRGPMLLVGPGRLLTKVAPDLKLDDLKADGLLIESVGKHLVFAGDQPRGALYAVFTFLEDVVGCRWWSSSVSTIPSQPDLTVPEQHVRYIPPLEYREPFWTDAFDGDWAVRNKSNGTATRLDDQRGGKYNYGGLFVHTFFNLVPPAEQFAAHPEWYSEIGGERLGGKGEYVQLCVTNEELKKFTAQRLIRWLKDHPEANIVSVSQNDADNHCLCANCRKLEEEEGSPAGPLLHFVNYVAAEVAKVYPDVAIDTLAYQYTRKPPKHVKPLPNVIVRLCTIECDFAHPLTAESNRKFAEDIEGWSKICNRVYIWDYVTDFAHYIQPHPNLRVLGPNIRFFVKNGVKGIFEQGAYTSRGAEFAELKAWVLAKLLWNPELDGDKLVEEFVAGYYGKAAPYISQYIKLMHDEAEATNTYLSCFMHPAAPFLNLKTLAAAEKLMAEAEAAAEGDPALLQRVQVARLPLRYVWAMRWYSLQDEAATAGEAWPGPADYRENAQTFMDVAQAYGITMISEGGPLVNFERLTLSIDRGTSPPPPDCQNLPREQWMDFQDAAFGLYQAGTLAAIKEDELATDKAAAWMTGATREWAVQQPLMGKPLSRDATYSVYASIRVEKAGNAGPAFTTGIYDAAARDYLGSLAVSAAEVPDDGQYHTYKLATTALNDQAFLWAAPAANEENIKAVWVDRFWIVKE
jgi:hypothetical protein